MSLGRERQPIKTREPMVPCPPYVEQLVRRTDSQQPSTRPALATATRMRYRGLIQGFLDSAERFASREALVVDDKSLSYRALRGRAAAIDRPILDQELQPLPRAA